MTYEERHVHLCLSCQEPYYIEYINNKEPDLLHHCGCGTERIFGNYKKKEPMTATELEDRYRIIGAEIQNEMCKLLKPVIIQLIRKIEESNKT